jgi:hypothetical protein
VPVEPDTSCFRLLTSPNDFAMLITFYHNAASSANPIPNPSTKSDIPS